VLPFGRLWYDGLNAAANAAGYAEHYSRSHDAVIRVYDSAGNVIQTHSTRTRNVSRTLKRTLHSQTPVLIFENPARRLGF
jgi:hypothetical protein